MTFAQFRRLKPKYKLRLILVMMIALLLFILLMVGVSFGVRAIRTQLNTTELKGFTSENVLLSDGLIEILSTVKQDDALSMYVTDSELVMRGDGKITSVTVNFVNIQGEKQAELWRLTANEKKASLRKLETKFENMLYLQNRNVRFGSYYPAMSRVTSPELLQFLEQNAPVGAAGTYTFRDEFGNNLSPLYSSYLEGGMVGVWVSQTGSATKTQAAFTQPSVCVPYVVTTKAVNTQKSKGKKIVYEDAKESVIALLQEGAY